MGCLDEILFEELFYKHYDKVYAGLLAKTHSDDVARELTQLTFIKLWEYRSSFSEDINAETQLFRKARQIFIDWLRKEAHQRKLMEELQQVSKNVTSPLLELTDTLRKSIDQLPAMQKTVFSMAYIEGFANKEIAEELGISVRTVERHIYKSLKKLRKILAFLTVIFFISKNLS